MATNVYNCPCCGAPLAFSGESGNLECASCGNSFDLQALEMMHQNDEKSVDVSFAHPDECFQGENSGVSAYICKNCGAELMTEETTTATSCPYCGSPTILPDRIDGSAKPEKVIPFAVTQQQAKEQFEGYFKGKKLLPNVFLNEKNRISEMRKLYVPYWLFDCTAQGDIVYDATRTHVERTGEWEITHTRHYAVRRRGKMRIENIPVDGSAKLDNKITESLEPFDLNTAIPFQPAILAGAMADAADVDSDTCEARAVERVTESVESKLRSTVNNYDTVTTRSKHFRTDDGRATPVLMPVWLIATKKGEKTYTFAINGQTGKLTCDVPADKKKAFLWGAGVFAGVLAAAAGGLAIAKMLGTGTILIAALVALIIAFCVVAGLKSQLKQAKYQGAAGDYVREDSFRLEMNFDQFLYETKTKRKIESNPKKS